MDPLGLECADVHDAYLEACRAIPDLAADFIARGRDPADLMIEIAPQDGPVVMEVPFDEVLNLRSGRSSRLILPRSRRATVAAAQKYRTAFTDAPFGVVIVTPDLEHVSVNRAVTEITGETDETTQGLSVESEEIRSRDPGNTVPRAVVSMAMARNCLRGIRDRKMFWGEVPHSAERPPLTLSYWPILEDRAVVALCIRIDTARRLG